jgi:hypothetical protein
MVLDEAPAATTGGFNGKGNVDRAEIGSAWQRRLEFPRSGPASLVAAEIHLGCKPAASVTAGCTATFKLRAIRVSQKTLCEFRDLSWFLGTLAQGPTANSGRQPKN